MLVCYQMLRNESVTLATIQKTSTDDRLQSTLSTLKALEGAKIFDAFSVVNAVHTSLG